MEEPLEPPRVLGTVQRIDAESARAIVRGMGFDPQTVPADGIELLLDPYRETTNNDITVVLYQDEERRGWADPHVGEAAYLLPHVHGQASSLDVLYGNWVTFYSKSVFRGSELYVRGPFYVSELRRIPKNNFGQPRGNWSDEIGSFRLNTSRPGGDGTYVNDNIGAPPSQPQPPCTLLVIEGYGLNSQGGKLNFYVASGGCSNNLASIDESRVRGKVRNGATCRQKDVYTITYCK